MRAWRIKWIGMAAVLVSVLFSGSVRAQTEKTLLQLGVGGNAYRGDLGGNYKKWKATFHAGLRFNRSKRLNGSFQLAVGSLTGQTSDPEYPGEPDKTPNLHFKTSILSVNYELHYNIIKTDKVIWYAGQGFGIMHYNPKDEFGNALRERNDTRAEGESYGSITVVLPTKMGAIYFLPNALGLGAEAGFYNTLTDYLDNISEWGTKSGRDNALYIRMFLNVPVNF
jgi:hypothetical protein